MKMRMVVRIKIVFFFVWNDLPFSIPLDRRTFLSSNPLQITEKEHVRLCIISQKLFVPQSNIREIRRGISVCE